MAVRETATIDRGISGVSAFNSVSFSSFSSSSMISGASGSSCRGAGVVFFAVSTSFEWAGLAVGDLSLLSGSGRDEAVACISFEFSGVSLEEAGCGSAKGSFGASIGALIGASLVGVSVGRFASGSVTREMGMGSPTHSLALGVCADVYCAVGSVDFFCIRVKSERTMLVFSGMMFRVSDSDALSLDALSLDVPSLDVLSLDVAESDSAALDSSKSGTAAARSASVSARDSGVVLVDGDGGKGVPTGTGSPTHSPCPLGVYGVSSAASLFLCVACHGMGLR